MMKFEDRVLKYEFQLNDTDDEIIDYIRKNRHQINKLSIQKIASDLYTVPNSVMRLTKKLGYTGFSQLKVLIQQEENDENQIAKSQIPKNVIKTIELIDYDKLYDAAKKMKMCKTIHFLGVGDSLSYCEMMVRHVRCLDKRAEYYQ
ncbi:MurR/RpiR family transcriptional regulator, partial [Coprobacillus cateniformis]|nr:MurR/RpiR family transcriptional regulator [Coprobacillus cateniformis]